SGGGGVGGGEHRGGEQRGGDDGGEHHQPDGHHHRHTVVATEAGVDPGHGPSSHVHETPPTGVPARWRTVVVKSIGVWWRLVSAREPTVYGAVARDAYMVASAGTTSLSTAGHPRGSMRPAQAAALRGEPVAASVTACRVEVPAS